MAKGFDSSLAQVYTSRPMRVLVGTLAVVGVLGLVIAQVGAQSPPEEDALKEGTPEGETKPIREDALRSDRPSAPDVDVANAQNIPTAEKQTTTEEKLGEMRAALKRVTEILGEARASKDIVQLNCVNEKLTQVKGLLRISEDASVKMYDAIASNAQDVINHEFTKIVVAHQKTQILRAQAEQCVGELSVYTGETEIVVEIDEDISDRDPTEPEGPPPGPEVPPVASAF
jgi:hypothetical protein